MTDKTVALITGGAQGLGRAICLQMAKQGSNIAVVDIDEKMAKETAEMCEKEHNVTAIGYECDVSKSDPVEELIKKIAEDFKGLNYVVNNAGITRDTFLKKMTEDQWDSVMNVNLKSMFLVSKASLALMQANKWEGAIVNMSSIVGKVGNLGQTNYAASKAGAIGFTKALAKETARSKIRVNAVLPGFIITPMTDHVPQKVIDKIVAEIPLGRMGNAEDIAEAVGFLASPKGAYITGTTLEVTGGLWA